MADKNKEIDTIKDVLLADKMQELRIRMSNGNTFSYLGKALFTSPEVDQVQNVAKYEVYPPEENDEGEMLQGIRIYWEDGRIGEYVGSELATEQELEDGVHIASFQLGYPEDVTDEIRKQVDKDLEG